MLVTILMAGIALTIGLSLDKFRHTHSDLLTSRFQFIVNDIRHKLETQMDLGLALSTLQDVSEELDSYRRNDEMILSIEVFDEKGSVLFSTDPSFIGDLVSEEWVFAWRANQNSTSWSRLERDAAVVGVPIQNNLNQNVGSLALRYSREFLDQSFFAQTRHLITIGLVVAVFMAIMSLVGCILLLRGTITDLKSMTQAFKDIMNNEKDSKHLEATIRNHPEFESFSTSVLNVQVALSKASSDVIELDETES
ncbi:MAG: hypothetical protein OXI60_05525 [Acidiferrobacterales bacterium]|nr:hypothetical protein [Acidiferrobacterales bacterium]